MRHVGLAVTLAIAATGCNSILGIEDLTLGDGGAPPQDDGTIDASGFCYGSLVAVCRMTEPSMDIVLPPTIDTGTSSLCTVVPQTGGSEVCAIIGHDVTVPAAGTVATGTRPLMLVASHALAINGKLDVGSRISGNQVGAGANPASCGTAPNAPMATNGIGGGGGGAGGSFGGKGGNGGDGAGGGSTKGPMSHATITLPLAVLRGGCPGGRGGDNSSAVGGGPGGAGGGAVYLVSPGTILIASDLWASGAGGKKTVADHSGGGGGGSGGLVVLESPTITLNSTGSIAVHGGGGGAGEDTSPGPDGGDNQAWNATPIGGVNTGNGGDGGDGAHLSGTGTPGPGAAGGDGSGNGGGGGGGGGQGLLLYRGAIANATQTAPAPNTF